MQWVKLAWNKDQRIAMPSFDAIDAPEKPRIGDSRRARSTMISAIRRRAPRQRVARGVAGGGDDIRAEIRRIILEELAGDGGALMAKLRSYIFIDQLQPGTMCYLGSFCRGFLPRANMAAHRDRSGAGARHRAI